jgi:hypothetical protein
VVTAILQRHGVEALGGAADVDADGDGCHGWGASGWVQPARRYHYNTLEPLVINGPKTR